MTGSPERRFSRIAFVRWPGIIPRGDGLRLAAPTLFLAARHRGVPKRLTLMPCCNLSLASVMKRAASIPLEIAL